MIKKYNEFSELRELSIKESVVDIASICKEYYIKNWTLNPDGSIDVDGDVTISMIFLTKLPLKFGKVTGNFNCNDNKLTTLEGCPTSVGGYFCCHNNQLTTLEGCPTSVSGYFACNDNQLTTLEGSPKLVDGGFECHRNQLTTLEGCPTSVGGDFNCRDNKLTTFEGICDDIKGALDCRINKIINFYGFPDRLIGIELYLSDNPLGEIYHGIVKGDSRCIDLLNMTRSIYGHTVREMGILDIADAIKFDLDEDWRYCLKSYTLVP